jgi:hypothetical protein
MLLPTIRTKRYTITGMIGGRSRNGYFNSGTSGGSRVISLWQVTIAIFNRRAF